MVNENKIRILYVQPGKYPEERFVANELHPLQRLAGGYPATRTASVLPKSLPKPTPTSARRSTTLCQRIRSAAKPQWNMTTRTVTLGRATGPKCWPSLPCRTT